MIRSVRAAGFAAAAFLVAAVAWSGPLRADQGAARAPSAHFLDHAGAAAEVSDLGVNDTEPEPVAVEPQAAPATLGDYAEHLIALADAALPRPRTLDELVEAYAGEITAGAEQDCLANAVYFEARGESLEGQLAVAEVVLNRTRSGRYPASICGVVTQPWQFSFVRNGVIPRANRASEAWRRAVAVARIAETEASRLLPRNVLWYHAGYVSPGWGRRLERTTRIGLHIFYS